MGSRSCRRNHAEADSRAALLEHFRRRLEQFDGMDFANRQGEDRSAM